jgi:hypothetical protein
VRVAAGLPAGERVGRDADVEVLPSNCIQEALTRPGRGDVRYRFVLHLSDLDQPAI